MSRAPAFIRNWNSPEMRVKAGESAGRPVRYLAGAWVTDLASLGKAVMLCDNCHTKFNPDGYGYERRDPAIGHRTANGQCDGCGNGKVWPVPCYMFLPKR